MGKFIAERFDNANRIIFVSKSRFYKTNLYEPLERIKNKSANLKLWDKFNDKRKLGAFYQKMRKAKDKQGNNDFSSEWIKRPDFIAAEKAFGNLLNHFDLFDLKLIDSVIIPFIKQCELEELRVNS
jgi:hypothetical protein